MCMCRHRQVYVCIYTHICVCVLKYLTITELVRSAVYIGELQKISEGHVI